MDYTGRRYFDHALKNASDNLIRKAETLRQMQFSNWDSKALELSMMENADVVVHSLRSVKQPVIYFFQFNHQPDHQVIVNRIKDYKLNGNSDSGSKENRNCVKVRKVSQTNPDTNILYVGSTGARFHARIQQHLGFGPKSTYALQLVHWAKNLGLQLTLHWMQLPTESHDFRYDIEDALAEQMTPLVGKRGAN